MKQMKFVLSFLITLVLMLTLVALQFSLFTKTKLLNSDFYISMFQKNNLYSSTKQDTESKLLNLGRVVNLPKELFQGIVTEEWVKQEIDASTKQTIKYLTYKADTMPTADVKPLADKFNSNLDNYIKSQNLKVDKNVQTELTKIKSDAGNIIKNQTSVINLKSLEKNSSFQKARKSLGYLNNSLLPIIGVIIVLVVLLCLTNLKSISSFVSWVGYALVSGGLIVVIPSVLGLATGFIKNIALGDVVIKNVVISITNQFLTSLLFCGIGVILSGIFIVYISLVTSKKDRYSI